MSGQAHELAGLYPLDRGRYRWISTCICGWRSPECKRSGQATIAGWTHIREAKESAR